MCGTLCTETSPCGDIISVSVSLQVITRLQPAVCSCAQTLLIGREWSSTSQRRKKTKTQRTNRRKRRTNERRVREESLFSAWQTSYSHYHPLRGGRGAHVALGINVIPYMLGNKAAWTRSWIVPYHWSANRRFFKKWKYSSCLNLSLSNNDWMHSVIALEKWHRPCLYCLHYIHAATGYDFPQKN